MGSGGNHRVPGLQGIAGRGLGLTEGIAAPDSIRDGIRWVTEVIQWQPLVAWDNRFLRIKRKKEVSGARKVHVQKEDTRTEKDNNREKEIDGWKKGHG